MALTIIYSPKLMIISIYPLYRLEFFILPTISDTKINAVGNNPENPNLISIGVPFRQNPPNPKMWILITTAAMGMTQFRRSVRIIPRGEA